MPDFYSILDERMRIAWENLARETNENLRRSQADLRERGLLGSGFEFKEYARVRAEAITRRGEVIWRCISETLAALDPPFSHELSQRLHRFAEGYLPETPTEEYRALQELATRLNSPGALHGMKHEVDMAMHGARRTLRLRLDEEMLHRKPAAVQQSRPTTTSWSDGKKWAMGILSALLVAAILGSASYLSRRSPDVRNQEVLFTASTGEGFAIQSVFGGSAQVLDGELSVRVDRAEISYIPTSAGYAGPRRIVALRVSLVGDHDGNSWKPVRQSDLKTVGRELETGQTISLGSFVLRMSVAGLPSLSPLWLVFDIDEEIPGAAQPSGLSHAHSGPGLFSD